MLARLFVCAVLLCGSTAWTQSAVAQDAEKAIEHAAEELHEAATTDASTNQPS